MTTDLSARALELGDLFAANLDSDAQRYWSENRRRIAVVLGRVGALLASLAPSVSQIRVLDVGPAIEIELLAKLFPTVQLETMGWADHRYRPTSLIAHHPVDLNDTADPAQCPHPEVVDVVLLLEIIEHVHISPLHVFRYLRTCLRPGGYLVVSTPNAAWLRNRWRMLCGRNPFELIRQDAGNPGHFREFTRNEMTGLLEQVGFHVSEHRIENLYEFSSASGRRFTHLAAFLPSTFRHDMLFIARRRD